MPSTRRTNDSVVLQFPHLMAVQHWHKCDDPDPGTVTDVAKGAHLDAGATKQVGNGGLDL